MIKILAICEEIKKYLEEQAGRQIVKDFRICLRKNENLYVNIVLADGKEENEDLTNAIARFYKNAEIEYFSEEQQEDPFYQSIFSSPEVIQLRNGHRRNSNLSFQKSKNGEANIPVVLSFYSYKGGMGRTTALAAFAIYMSAVCHKKVVVVDCDFEAPGLNNFFLKYPAEQNHHNGLIEYMIDRGTAFAETRDVVDYMQEVDHTFSGDGSIYVMPAGNMNIAKIKDTFKYSHFDHYLEGISRIDINNAQYADKLFASLVSDINQVVHPDIICFDSKTGINDIMGLAVCSLADIVVGFFRNDVQTLPGLYFFIKTLMNNHKVEPFLVNSILPSAMSQHRALFSQFKNDVEDIINEIDDESNISFPCYPIGRQSDFEFLGSVAESVSDFVDTIRNAQMPDYSNLFDALAKSVQKHRQPTGNAEMRDKERLRKEIVYSVSETLNGIDLYAENQSIESDIEKRHFYYRRCMNDLLNHDKYLVIGSKGTGKSYIYHALKDANVLKLIKQNAGKTDDFHFVYAIDRTKNRFFDVAKLDNLDSASKYKFWLIYTWNIVALDIQREFPDYMPIEGVQQVNITDTITSREQLSQLIADDGYAQAIENEFIRLDDYLKSCSSFTYLDIIFDQLDEMVQPTLWNQWIPDLIRFWRVKRYSRLGAKLFVRRDLFRSLVGLTNINDIENQAIDIEWRREEIYSYFFYVILKGDTEQKFWQLMNLYEEYPKEYVEKLKKEYDEKIVPLYENKMLEAMMGTFFGENVDVEGSTRMGRSYEWFYRNLKNADGTISLRPFISLLQGAVKKQIEDESESDSVMKDYPVLNQMCYINSKVRKEAVEGYLNDLIRNAKGNMPIQYVFDYISNSRNARYHRISMRRNVFEELLLKVMDAYSDKEDMNGMNLELLTKILVDNGIVAVQNKGSVDFYTFSFLYKYRLGLHGS